LRGQLNNINVGDGNKITAPESTVTSNLGLCIAPSQWGEGCRRYTAYNIPGADHGQVRDDEMRRHVTAAEAADRTTASVW